MKNIETYSLHQAGNVTRRLGQLPGASELPRLVVTVERGTEPHVMAEQLRRLAAVIERHSGHEAEQDRHRRQPGA